MLTILIVILVLIWAAVVWSIYSNFMVFYSNFSETENYHRAYYASISALERAELVTKQRQPGYEWSGGFINGAWTWSSTNWWSDGSLPFFSYYWDNKDDTSVFRTIKSKTNRIPATWNWDVEWMLAYVDSGNSGNPENSSNYNMMDYENAEVFLLYNDKSRDNPYKKVSSDLEGNNYDLEKVSLNKINWQIRLPKLLKDASFWNLDENTSFVWQNGVLPPNDAIVDWQIRWFKTKPFVIYSTQSVDFGGNDVQIDGREDSVFRESDINNTLNLNFEFWNNGWSPFKDAKRRENSSPFVSSPSITVIGEAWNDVSGESNFNNILNKWYATQLRFSLLNLLQWSGNNIYPFLEYYIDFWGMVPDKYFTIDAEWAYKDYKVNMIIKKPTIKESVFWSFTSIF